MPIGSAMTSAVVSSWPIVIAVSWNGRLSNRSCVRIRAPVKHNDEKTPMTKVTIKKEPPKTLQAIHANAASAYDVTNPSIAARMSGARD